MREHHLGHRQRLRERLLRGNEEALPDYELLELILFLSYPRGDVKPLAKELLRHFKSLTGIFQAPQEDLKLIKGMGEASAATFKAIRLVATRLALESIENRPILSDLEQLVRYCRLRLQDIKIEQFHVFYLDKKYQFIADEIHQKGTIDHTMVYPRELIKKALYYGATSLLLAHNHPTGDCTPSQSDIDLTNYIVDAGKKLGVGIYDHLIISMSGYYSMKAKGLLN